MRLKAKPINFEAGGRPIVILNRQDVEALGVHGSERVRLTRRGRTITAIADVTQRLVDQGEVGTNDVVSAAFNIRRGDSLEVSPAYTPESVAYIKQKIAGARLSNGQMRAIVKDVVARRLSETELAAFVTALDARGMSTEEVEALSRAMYETGKQLKVPGRPIVDKHSIGGIPGDKISLLAVPVIAAGGLVIPKTSSRAITSPAGTADRMEVLAPVEFTAEQIVSIVKRTKGCLVWGGALDLAPADDAFIKAEFPLGIDPLLLPSIMSKKKAVGAQYVVIDMPTGRGAKIKTIGAANELAGQFIELGRRLDIRIAAAITYGEQPLGRAIGPALEAREALEAIRGRGPADVIDKVTSVVGILFEMVGVRRGKEQALRLLRSGRAERKLREIIAAQGGDPRIRPSDIPIGKKSVTVRTDSDSRVLWIMNAEMSLIAREAGAPADRGAGVLLHAKVGDTVKKGMPLLTIYSDHARSLRSALRLYEEYAPIGIGKSVTERMLMAQVPTKLPMRRLFVLER